MGCKPMLENGIARAGGPGHESVYGAGIVDGFVLARVVVGRSNFSITLRRRDWIALAADSAVLCSPAAISCALVFMASAIMRMSSVCLAIASGVASLMSLMTKRHWPFCLRKL